MQGQYQRLRGEREEQKLLVQQELQGRQELQELREQRVKQGFEI